MILTTTIAVALTCLLPSAKRSVENTRIIENNEKEASLSMVNAIEMGTRNTLPTANSNSSLSSVTSKAQALYVVTMVVEAGGMFDGLKANDVAIQISLIPGVKQARSAKADDSGEVCRG